MDTEILYVVVATDKQTGKREAISTPLLKPLAQARQKACCENYQLKKMYKYFHVAKHPYKSK